MACAARRYSSFSATFRYATDDPSRVNAADTPGSSATSARAVSLLRMRVRRDVSSPVS
jgi:hypothetical protein